MQVLHFEFLSFEECLSTVGDILGSVNNIILFEYFGFSQVLYYSTSIKRM